MCLKLNYINYYAHAIVRLVKLWKLLHLILKKQDMVVKISDLLDITLDELLKEDKVMTRSLSNKIRNNKYYKVTIIVLLVALVASIIGIYMYNRSLAPYREWYREHITNPSHVINQQQTPVSSESLD